MYRAADCLPLPPGELPEGKVFVTDNTEMNRKYHKYQYQLYFCLPDTKPDSFGAFPAYSLYDGAEITCYPQEVLGELPTERLPLFAKVGLSQLRPFPRYPYSRDRATMTARCFLENGRPCRGVGLETLLDVLDYSKMQAPYQHRVGIWDQHGELILECRCGLQTYPTPEECRSSAEAEQEEQFSGMVMS